MRLPVARQSELQKDQWNRGVRRGASGGRSCSPRLWQCGLGLMQLATMGLFHPQLCWSTFTLIMSPLCVRNISQFFCTLTIFSLVSLHDTVAEGFLSVHLHAFWCYKQPHHDVILSAATQMHSCTLPSQLYMQIVVRETPRHLNARQGMKQCEKRGYKEIGWGSMGFWTVLCLYRIYLMWWAIF